MTWLRSQGLSTPDFECFSRSDRLSDRPGVLQFGPPWVVKPDISLGGKGNRGLVRFASSAQEVEAAITTLFDQDVLGTEVSSVIVEEAVPGDEFYLSVALDGAKRAPMVRLALRGGVGFDAGTAGHVYLGSFTAAGAADQFQDFVDEVCGEANTPLAVALEEMVSALWQCFFSSEAVLLELNPLKWDGQSLRPVGIALEFDEDAQLADGSTRPASLEQSSRPRTAAERDVVDLDKSLGGPSMKFIELDGDVALLVVGGGASLVAFDYLAARGIDPACYADYSPGAGLDKLVALLRAGLSRPGLKGAMIGAAILSLMDCRTFAEAIDCAIKESGYDPRRLPTVVRLAGSDEEQAHRLLSSIPGLLTVGRDTTIEEACQLLVDRLS